MSNLPDRLAEKCAIIFINEIKPRAKKLGMEPYEFCPPHIAATLSRLELDGYYTRRDVRRILDVRVQIQNDLFSKNKVEESPIDR